MNSYIFDIDGTIWDATEVCARAYNASIAQWHAKQEGSSAPLVHVTADDLRGVFGRPMEEIRDTIFAPYPEEARKKLMADATQIQYVMLRETPPTPYDGVADAMQALHENGCQLFVVSNCEAGYVPLMLETTGLKKYIIEGICPDDTGMLKAENIRYIVDKYQLKHPVYVGDTGGDEKASRKAGVPFYFASYGYGQVEAPDRVLHSMRDLIDENPRK